MAKKLMHLWRGPLFLLATCPIIPIGGSASYSVPLQLRLSQPVRSLADAPAELQIAVQEFWPADQWDNAVSIAWLESGWNAFAERDTTDNGNIPCGAIIRVQDGVAISAEHSVSWFQINSCNFPDWPMCYLFNTRHNAGTAHMLWATRGWWPWFYSARALGLL